MIPSHKRPRCPKCHTRAAVQDLQTDQWTVPCYICTAEGVIEDIGLKLYRDGNRIMALTNQNDRPIHVATFHRVLKVIR